MGDVTVVVTLDGYKFEKASALQTNSDLTITGEKLIDDKEVDSKTDDKKDDTKKK